MRIRHLIAIDNVDADGWVVDPMLVRHGLIVGGQVAALAGAIEPLTHLNLDFSGHRLDLCLVVERLAGGAVVVWNGDRFQSAAVRPSAYRHLGVVSIESRRLAWQRTVEF
jgi:hypothetical protein